MSFFCNIKLVTDYLPSIQHATLQFEPTYHRVAQAFGEWPVVINEDGLKARLFEWGLIADYMNTPEKVKEYRMAMANARSEKILGDKRSVWHRLRRQRCQRIGAVIEESIPVFHQQTHMAVGAFFIGIVVYVVRE